ncbi:hypothetical protein EDC01DRAFT_431231 [Geopyxis carbonaria]|nr:hypothetical protein EDC01DRAFT_431231 [Geopyxis carbonaria]
MTEVVYRFAAVKERIVCIFNGSDLYGKEFWSPFWVKFSPKILHLKAGGHCTQSPLLNILPLEISSRKMTTKSPQISNMKNIGCADRPMHWATPPKRRQSLMGPPLPDTPTSIKYADRDLPWTIPKPRRSPMGPPLPPDTPIRHDTGTLKRKGLHSPAKTPKNNLKRTKLGSNRSDDSRLVRTKSGPPQGCRHFPTRKTSFSIGEHIEGEVGINTDEPNGVLLRLDCQPVEPPKELTEFELYANYENCQKELERLLAQKSEYNQKVVSFQAEIRSNHKTLEKDSTSRHHKHEAQGVRPGELEKTLAKMNKHLMKEVRSGYHFNGVKWTARDPKDGEESDSDIEGGWSSSSDSEQELSDDGDETEEDLPEVTL